MRRKLAAGMTCAIVGFTLTSIAPAATFHQLYTVTVEQDDEGSVRRSSTIRRGMSLLLDRITGVKEAAANPVLQPLIDNAERYLAGYDLLPASKVRVGFNPFEVNRELTRLNVPIWGAERPLTLVWIAADFGNGEHAELRGTAQVAESQAVAGAPSKALSDEASQLFASVADEILAAADERGLPIVLPILDAEDRRHASFDDLWSGLDHLVGRAAERYSVDAVLIGRVVATGSSLEQVQWTVLRGDQRENLSAPRARSGIDWLADRFASELTTTGETRRTLITLKEINSWTDWRIVDYLRSLSIVESVDVRSITGSDLVLELVARGDETQLQDYLTLDRMLQPVDSEAGLVFMPSWHAATDRAQDVVENRPGDPVRYRNSDR